VKDTIRQIFPVIYNQKIKEFISPISSPMQSVVMVLETKTQVRELEMEKRYG